MALLCLLTLTVAVSALYSSQHISEVPYHSLRPTIEQTNFLTLSVVYDPDGEKSKKLEPIVLNTAETYQHLIRTRAVNCYSDKEKCTAETRESLPGVMVSYYAGLDPVSKEKKVFQETFLGGLTVKGLGEFILSQMPFFGTEVTYRNMQWFLDRPKLQKVLLFSDRDTVPSLYKAVTSAFRGRLDFGIVWKNQTDIVEKYGVKWFPTLLVLEADRRLEYDGDLNFEELHRFLVSHAADKEEVDRYIIAKPIETEPATKLTPLTYREALEGVVRPAVVYFYAGKTEADWEQFKVTYRGVVDFFEMDLDQEELPEDFLLSENIPHLPHIKMQFSASSKPRPIALSALPEYLLENIPQEMVRVDVDVPKTFLEHMKRIEKLGAIFVTEGEVPVQFRALTKDHYLRDKVLFGVYRNETVEKYKELFKLTRVPALMATYSVRGEEIEFREYSGDVYNNVQMRYFLEQLMIPLYQNETSLPIDSWKDEEIEELTSKTFTQACTKRSSFCLIALLEGGEALFKSKKNRDALTTLKKAQAYAEAKTRPFRFSYLDGDCEFEIRKAMGIKDKDLPAFVAFQGVKNLGFRLGEEATETNMRLFIDKLTHDREKGLPMEITPADRNCKHFRTELKRLGKEKPEATRKELLQEYLDLEKLLKAEGKLGKKAKKKGDL